MKAIKSITKYSTLSDEELLVLFKEASGQDVLAELYLRYYEMLYGVALRYLSDTETAKDAVMNIYMELQEKLPHQEIRIFKNWLYVFTRNHCLMQLRKDKKKPVIRESEQIMQSPRFMHHDNDEEKEQMLVKLEDCLKTLVSEQRTSVSLFFLQSKSYNEIAEQTGLEWNKVRSLIQNGKRNLKICMEKKNEQ